MGEFLESVKEMAREAERVSLNHSSKIMILSDLHLGDGSSSDDFTRNEAAVLDALRSWYLPRGFLLILNGDVEDLHKASFQDIRAGHEEFYRILTEFSAKGLLRKIIGNHDLGLLLRKDLEYPVSHALRLEWRGRSLLVYHGHQASTFFVRYNYLSHFVVHYLANPLRIKNAEVPMTSKRRFRAERRIYKASRKLGLVSITGHTHRPLFESLSKYDSLRFKLETLIRQYMSASEEEKGGISEIVGVYSAELRRLAGKDRKKRSRSLYESEEALMPCLFNSGCATGKSGFTAIEIEDGAISMVYWTASDRARPYVDRESLSKEILEGTPWVRYVLNRDLLDYVVARAELLR